MASDALPNQTVGPYFSIGLSWLYRSELAGPGARGERVTVRGRVLDGAGKGVSDALLEVWQASADGKYTHPDDARPIADDPALAGFGRIPTDDQGAFRFDTVVPGPVPGPGGRTQAPHLVINVFMRGLLRHLVTRLYFPDHPGNAADPVLALVEQARRGTLVARRAGPEAGALAWDVVLQGDGETVFFDC